MLEDRAKELGRLIGQSSEYQAVKRANDALGADADAVAVLKQMEQQLDELLLKVQGSPVYQSVMVAQENFDKVMTHVNEWILDGIRRGAASPIITLG